MLTCDGVVFFRSRFFILYSKILPILFIWFFNANLLFLFISIYWILLKFLLCQVIYAIWNIRLMFNRDCYFTSISWTECKTEGFSIYIWIITIVKCFIILHRRSYTIALREKGQKRKMLWNSKPFNSLKHLLFFMNELLK